MRAAEARAAQISEQAGEQIDGRVTELEQQLAALTEERDTLRGRAGELESERSQLGGRLERLVAELASLTAARADAEHTAANVNTELAAQRSELESQIEALQDRLRAAEARATQISDQAREHIDGRVAELEQQRHSPRHRNATRSAATRANWNRNGASSADGSRGSSPNSPP